MVFMPSKPRQLVVFDFDWSLADQDTDRYVFEVLNVPLRREMEDLEGRKQWTDIVTQSLRKLHERGGTKEQIQHTLCNLPFHPAMVRAVKQLQSSSASDTTFFCLSNSNSVFISTILEDKNLTDLFTEIVTNPAKWNDSGLLELRRRVDPNGPQHGCKIGCSANMCKGAELVAFLERHEADFDKVFYVGDGGNDFCPILRLRSQDMVFARKGRDLEKRIHSEGKVKGLKCQVEYWDGAWELEEHFAKL